jgi:retron-type reverse transcriptase
MLRLIERFLKAGVMIEGRRHETDDGVPQGAVLSPLHGTLANKAVNVRTGNGLMTSGGGSRQGSS